MKRAILILAALASNAGGLALLTAGCAAPGMEVTPQPEDFAFLEVKLKG